MLLHLKVRCSGGFVILRFSHTCRRDSLSGKPLKEDGDGGAAGSGRSDKYLPLGIPLSRVVFVDSRPTLQNCWEAIAKVRGSGRETLSDLVSGCLRKRCVFELAMQCGATIGIDSEWKLICDSSAERYAYVGVPTDFEISHPVPLIGSKYFNDSF